MLPTNSSDWKLDLMQTSEDTVEFCLKWRVKRVDQVLRRFRCAMEFQKQTLVTLCKDP